jgi:hypothetical protein
MHLINVELSYASYYIDWSAENICEYLIRLILL